jgi:hypothetical protein
MRLREEEAGYGLPAWLFRNDQGAVDYIEAKIHHMEAASERLLDIADPLWKWCWIPGVVCTFFTFWTEPWLVYVSLGACAVAWLWVLGLCGLKWLSGHAVVGGFEIIAPFGVGYIALMYRDLLPLWTLLSIPAVGLLLLEMGHVGEMLKRDAKEFRGALEQVTRDFNNVQSLNSRVRELTAENLRLVEGDAPDDDVPPDGGTWAP